MQKKRMKSSVVRKGSGREEKRENCDGPSNALRKIAVLCFTERALTLTFRLNALLLRY